MVWQAVDRVDVPSARPVLDLIVAPAAADGHVGALADARDAGGALALAIPFDEHFVYAFDVMLDTVKTAILSEVDSVIAAHSQRPTAKRGRERADSQSSLSDSDSDTPSDAVQQVVDIRDNIEGLLSSAMLRDAAFVAFTTSLERSFEAEEGNKRRRRDLLEDVE
jgi:hypothetical protein